MGRINLPKKVRLITAMCYKDSQLKDQALALFIKKFGQVEETSEQIAFMYTSYYEDEMGTDLHKLFYTFEQLIDPIILSDVKIFSNSIEDKFSKSGKRQINIDPGYIEPAKLVLATTKNFSHRIYIGKGIYGDVQLYWKGGAFNINPWTYPDYKNEHVKAFFERVRNNYFHKIKGN